VSRAADVEQRLEEAADLAMQIASGNLQARLPISTHGDSVDAVVAALNMLAEELQHERHTRRHTEELLQDELDGYEHAPALFCSLDAESLVVEKCNQTLAEALGRPKTRILGRSVLELYVPEQRESARRALLELPRSTPLDQGDAQLSRAEGGALLVSASATRVRGGDERERVRIIWRDVTRERSLEAQLIETQKLEAIGRLCGGVAHDFNNILAVIAGAASLTQNLLAERGLDVEDMTLIQQAVDRGAALVSDLLAFSRRQVVKPVATDVRGILEEAVRMVSRLVGSPISVRSEIADVALTVLIDPSQLSQVLINLAINARDAMPDGGTLLLKASRLDIGKRHNVPRGPMPAGSNEHLELPAGSYVLLSVSDTGVGMTPGVLARAFEPFFTTKAVGRGSGLGLSMCYGIVQQAGGRIGIQSRVGQGTTVNVYLPRSSMSSHPPSRPEPAVLETGRETLLVVEDDLAVCNVTRRVLERAGYQVLVAENGQRALETMEASPREIALVITDISMPGMSGQELGVELRHRRPQIKILYLSGYSPQQLTASDPAGGEAEFLGKPFTTRGLLEKVRRVLDRSRG
jgi:two-component system cell cycle sensor histidine kinase/response regulator CckA